MAIIKKEQLIPFMDKVGDTIYIVKIKNGEIVVLRTEDNFTKDDIDKILKDSCK